MPYINDHLPCSICMQYSGPNKGHRNMQFAPAMDATIHSNSPYMPEGISHHIFRILHLSFHTQRIRLSNSYTSALIYYCINYFLLIRTSSTLEETRSEHDHLLHFFKSTFPSGCSFPSATSLSYTLAGSSAVCILYQSQCGVNLRRREAVRAITRVTH